MKYPRLTFSNIRRSAGQFGLGCALLALWPVVSQAAVTELANNPIANTQASKPNIMLIVDTSTSMRATHMPDDLEVFSADVQPIGYRSNQCNPLYFNPSTTYTLPKVVDPGTLALVDAPGGNFNAAPYNFYNTADTSTVDLRVAFQAYDSRTRLGAGNILTPPLSTPTSLSDTPQAAYYFVYTGSANLSAPNAYKTAPCTGPLPVAPATTVAATGSAGGTWTKVLVTSLTSDQQRNFAVWYTYYRTRMALVKSGIGRAFSAVDDKYRVGFISAAPLVAGSSTDASVPPASNAAVDGAKYEHIDDFTASQRQQVYGKLYGQNPGGDSPMREALARVGRHYSDYGNNTVGGTVAEPNTQRSDGINKGMPFDPVQSSCQRNYAIMTTDGYWNTTFETKGPVKMDGVTLVGQMDSPLTGTGINEYSPRPIFDGGSTAYLVEQSQTYKYTTQSCSDGSYQKVVTSNMAEVDQYNVTTTQQFRQTDTLKQGIQKQTMTTTTQTGDTVQLIETVTANTQVVDHTDQRTTKSTQLIETQNQLVTQVLRNDTQQTVTYKYVRKMVETATKTITSATMTTVWYTKLNTDTQQQEICTSSTQAGCSMHTTGAVAVDPGNASASPAIPAACAPALPSLNNGYQTVTCTGPTTVSSNVAINPYDACVGTSVYAAGQRVTCSARSTVVSYVGNINSGGTSSSSCTYNAGTSSPYVRTTCASSGTGTTVLTAALSDGTVSGQNIASASCTSTSSNISTALSVPSDATSSSGNTYTRFCPVVVVPVPTGASVPSGANSAKQYAVDPATCPVASWSPLTAKSTNNGSGLITTCTPVSTTSNPTFGTCTSPAAASPTWQTSTCTVTDNKVAGVAPYVSRATCPANSGPTISGSTRTTCTLVSDSTVAINSALCTPAMQGVSNFTSPNTTSCVTTTVGTGLGTTHPATCPATLGFNVPAGTGNTTTCSGGQISKGPVQACTTVANQIPNYTYSCSPSTVIGANITVNSCVAGQVLPGTLANNWITTTCNAPVVGAAVPVQAGTCSGSNNPGILVVCSSVQTILAANTVVAPGTCSTPGTTGANAYPNSITSTTTTFFDPGATPPGDGTTMTCGNTHVNWAQETVGTACVGTAVAANYFGAGTTGVKFTSAAPGYVLTSCKVLTTGPVAQSSGTPCTPGAVTHGASGNAAKDNYSCSMSIISAAAPSASCNSGPPASGSGFYSSSGQNYYRNCSFSQTTTTETSCTDNLVSNLVSNYTTTLCTATLNSWQLYASSTTASSNQAITGLDNISVGPPVTSTTLPTSPQPIGACTPSATIPQPAVGSSALADLLASAGVPSGHAAALVGAPSFIAPAGLSTNATVDPTTHAITTGSTISCSAWPCQLYSTSSNTGSSNSLADVAQYYYATDLRATSAWPNNVTSPSSAGPEDDRAAHQHMSTYVVGLGVSGQLVFNPNYRSLGQLTGDFADIRTGAKNWPVWPDASVAISGNYSDPRSIDDFWHAAVNGRGQYFSAADAYSMVAGIQGALNSINAVVGAGGGATTSTVTPTANDNSVFVPSFTLSAWTGDLQAQFFDLTASATAVTSTSDSWSAQALLDGKLAADRKIVFRQTGTSAYTGGGWTDLAQFTYGNLSSAQQAYFSAATVLSGTVGWSQASAMTAAPANQVGVAPGANLVNYLRGDRSYEGFAPGDVTKLYRKRNAVLGDIVGSQPVYVKQPSAPYTENGYPSFVTSNSTRRKMVYVGANDGMLHAFYAPHGVGDPNWANRGKEAWAYIPSQVMPNMYKLADAQYGVNHQFFVDGTPTVGDIFDGTQWRTILVGGLNAGGKGYYALDITNPDAPISLWEFTPTQDANVGFSFGRPIISKLVSGTWVVMFTSGYDNADGNGYVYVLNAVTGAKLKVMSTGVGSSGSPSGLREINNWVNNAALDNTTQRVYGGDLLGNVWRFAVNDSGSTGSGLQLATMMAADIAQTPQPITTRVELAEIGGDTYLFVGTGRLISNGPTQFDLADTSQQSIYSFKDIGVSYPSLNVRPGLKTLTITTTGSVANGTAVRTLGCAGTSSSCAQKTGWVLDLPEAGERMNINFSIGKGTLVFVSNVPAGDMCSNGHSWFNYLDMVSGDQVAGAPNAGVVLDSSLGVGLGLVDISGAAGSSLKAVGVSAAGNVRVTNIPWGTPPPIGKRISWREVVVP